MDETTTTTTPAAGQEDVKSNSEVLSSLANRPKITTHDRLTVRFSMIHEHFGDAAFPIETKWNEYLSNMTQPWSRKINVVQGTPLTFATLGVWPMDCGLIYVENRAKPTQVGNPTQAQLDACALQVLMVNGMPVRPSRFMLFEMIDISQLVIESQSGTVPAFITIISK
jgi:hypothetical protein